MLSTSLDWWKQLLDKSGPGFYLLSYLLCSLLCYFPSVLWWLEYIISKVFFLKVLFSMSQARARASVVLGAFIHSTCSNAWHGCWNATSRSGAIMVTQAISSKKCNKVVMDRAQPVSTISCFPYWCHQMSESIISILARSWHICGMLQRQLLAKWDGRKWT